MRIPSCSSSATGAVKSSIADGRALLLDGGWVVMSACAIDSFGRDRPAPRALDVADDGDQLFEQGSRAPRQACCHSAMAGPMATAATMIMATLVDMRRDEPHIAFDPRDRSARGGGRHAAVGHHRACRAARLFPAGNARYRISSRSAAPSPMTFTARTTIAAAHSAAMSSAFDIVEIRWPSLPLLGTR